MSLPAITVAVVGHTNTGKTSLLRTLTRDVNFGEISNRSATTRHVEGAALMVDGAPLVRLFDTPGLEDPIGLLALLDELAGGKRLDGLDLIQSFLAASGTSDFEQEAKALRQVLASDVAIYVIDARERVLQKHRDEMEILGRCARPILPLLNFVAADDARVEEWRAQLARVNMHAVVEFDTVALEPEGEIRLFSKMQSLLDAFRPTLERVIAHLREQRQLLCRASSELLAELLLDVAAFRMSVPVKARDPESALEPMRQAVRQREQQCVDALLDLHQFRPDDVRWEALPIDKGRWGLDLFSQEALRDSGVRLSSGAAAGAATGLAVDVALGGATLGAAAATGAAIGALAGGIMGRGRRLMARLRGYTDLRVDDATLQLLFLRQMRLLRALLRRGHASVKPIALAESGDTTDSEQVRIASQPLQRAWSRARAHPDWSRMSGPQAAGNELDTEREQVREQLTETILEALQA